MHPSHWIIIIFLTQLRYLHLIKNWKILHLLHESNNSYKNILYIKNKETFKDIQFSST